MNVGNYISGAAAIATALHVSLPFAMCVIAVVSTFYYVFGGLKGVAWVTILHKREGYRSAFQQFDPGRVARFNARTIEGLLRDPAIVRNRLKVEAAVNNARCILEVQGEFGSFEAYIWQFVDGVPIVGRRHRLRDLPSETRESQAMSKDLERRGFRFIGSTVCYAYMQAAGLANDHVTTCFRYRDLSI